MNDESQPREDGFEYQGTFYRWAVSDMGKDLMLIDRLCGLPVTEFFEVIADERESGRGPILLTLIATSLRAAHTDWSVERIARMVMELSMRDVVFVGADEADRDEAMLPPAEEPQPTRPPADAHSNSPSNGSSSSPTPPASETFKTLSETPR